MTDSEDSDNSSHTCLYLSQHMIEKLTMAALGPDIEDLSCGWNKFHAGVTSFPANKTKLDEMEKHLQRALRRCMVTAEIVLNKCLGQHVVDNAFFKVDMGDNNRGVFGVTPTDPMHAFESGIVSHFLQVVIDPLPDSAKSTLDTLAQQLFHCRRIRPGQLLDYPD